MTVEGRFWAKVRKTKTCWLWTGAKTGAGYGVFNLGYNRRTRSGQLVLAHQFSYGITHGPMAKGLQTDHLCRVPACVNPAHLEAVTVRENQLRAPRSIKARTKLQCSKGHSLIEGAFYLGTNGRKVCRICSIASNRRRYLKVRYHIMAQRKRRAKLTPLAVAEIRIAAADGHKQRDLARHFGVSESTISSVVNYTSWASPIVEAA